MRVSSDPNSANVEAHLLSNGSYCVAITSAGGGYSRWRSQAVTRWREDATRDSYGIFCYVRDKDSGKLWSNTWQPTATSADSYEAKFTQGCAEFCRVNDQIETYTQISVSPEDDIEARRVTLTNRSQKPRTLEVTSYAEVVIAAQAQDEAHPAFSNLFVQTELVRDRNAIYVTRRPRSAEEQPPWLLHQMIVRGSTVGEATYETDRMQFVGRCRSVASPKACDSGSELTDSEGAVLDPVVSIRQTVLIQPNESVCIDLISGIAESRSSIDGLADKYGDASMADRVFETAKAYSNSLLRQLDVADELAETFGRLAGSIIYASGLRRCDSSVLIGNNRQQSGLWRYGISGDMPIVLVRIRNGAHIELVRQSLQAHSYWRLMGLVADLVIWNDEPDCQHALQETIAELVGATVDEVLVDRPGGVFIRRSEQIAEEDRILLQSVARIFLTDDAGTLKHQTEVHGKTEYSVPDLQPNKPYVESSEQGKVAHDDLSFYNGLGGFSPDGREYVIILPPDASTPAPWVNVIANDQFGTVVSESGSAYTWAENSHEFRLTPWNNDPVTDICGEALYLRDEETGRYWSPSPLPSRGKSTYTVRHGFGYTTFEYCEDGLSTELCVYVAPDAPVKYCKLKITNQSGRPRKLSVTAFWELVLGDTKGRSQMHVVTEHDEASGAILARNSYNADFGDRVAFFNCSAESRSFTGDRAEFLGRNGSLAQPAAMRLARLSDRVGAGYDPCAAFQAPLTLADKQESTITFTLGATRNEKEAKELAQQCCNLDSAEEAIESVKRFWNHTLNAVSIETPDPSVNFLANGWLVYQTLACRMWARSGFYQSGGAFGFRDQLQDAMALVHAQPKILRDHLLLAAAHQFREGDVQHWWHPPVGRGVRTHFADDYLWLPLAICRYVGVTGDTAVLEERIPFLTSRLLRDDEESNYELPQIADESGTLYEHALRAIDRGFRFGVHGLPLMGCGDWNDGMNLVGQHGRGESVWLAFFQYYVINEFIDLASKRGDNATIDRLSAQSARLKDKINEHGWDGQWYRRAYFDDGTPLGSAENEECQIDSISQSWSVLSGAGIKERSTIAMESVIRHLVREKDRLIQLLNPPFDKSDLNPGYIKGYVAGVRENGGQYTHSAIWTVMATAALGDCDRAWKLFSLINPVTHSLDMDDASKYRVEPYVVAADVYGVAPHTGRGGWTWYTGSSGWMYRLIIESLVGLQRNANQLRIVPCLPSEWKQVKAQYRYGETFYCITIQNHSSGEGRTCLSIDGIESPVEFITLKNDGKNHEIVVSLG